MGVTQLAARLRSMGIPGDAYSIGSHRDESYCLVTEAGRWAVFYSERGDRTDEAVYASEEAACQELLTRLSRDHIVQDRMENPGT